MGFFSWLSGNGRTQEPPRTTTGLGHDHEYEEMYHTGERGGWVWKKGWYKCSICGDEIEETENIKYEK